MSVLAAWMENSSFNPTLEQAAVSEMNVAVAGTKEAILMVEAGAKEVSEQVMLDAILFGHEEIQETGCFSGTDSG